MKYIYCLTLAISPTMQCLYILLSGHTTMSDMPENPMVDDKIMNLLLFCPKLYQLIVRSWILCHLKNNKWPKHFSENLFFEEYMYQILFLSQIMVLVINVIYVVCLIIYGEYLPSASAPIEAAVIVSDMSSLLSRRYIFILCHP